ncbi:MAG TPA: hypothetical protein PLB55_07835 [Prosthecobacter sp.]|jgi:O-methyltransferase|nr:hypothetical protein [Prosthecobacter sp.]
MIVLHYAAKALERRAFWLYDTFHGLDSSVSSKDELDRHAGDFTECYAQVVAQFRPWSNVKVVQGTVPDVLHTVGPDQVAFLHIDLNAAVLSVGHRILLAPACVWRQDCI